MGFSLKGIARAVGNFFGGDDEEEKRRRQQQQQPQLTVQAPRQQAPSFNALGQQQRTNTIQDLLDPKKAFAPSPGIQLIQSNQTVAPLKPRVPTEQEKKQELQKLEDESYNAAKKQREQGEGWLGRNVLNKDNIEQEARMLAKSRAATKYQEKYGYNKDPTVLNLRKEAREIGLQHAAELEYEKRELAFIAKGATKAAQVAQYVPVTGTVLNLGLAGAEKTNVGGMKKDIANQRFMNEFGMTTEQFEALPPETQAKLQNIRNVGYALSPLDFTGLGGLGKSAAVSAVKKGATQLVKKGAIEVAEKEALKAAAKGLTKRTVLNTGIAATGQQYMGGETDLLEALKQGTLLTGTGELFSPVSLPKSKTPGIKSTNPNRIEDAAGQLQDQATQTQVSSQPAYQRGTPSTVGEAAAQQKLGVNNVPEGFNDADARVSKGTLPDPLDIPAYLRRNPEAAKQDAIARMAQADDLLEKSSPQNVEVRKFEDKQKIAAAFAESPEKGRAVARLLAARPENTGEGTIKAAGDRRVAAADYEAARQAEIAQRALDAGEQVAPPAGLPQAVENVADVPPTVVDPTNPRVAAPAAAAVPTPSAVAEAVPAPAYKPNASPDEVKAGDNIEFRQYGSQGQGEQITTKGKVLSIERNQEGMTTSGSSFPDLHEGDIIFANVDTGNGVERVKIKDVNSDGQNWIGIGDEPATSPVQGAVPSIPDNAPGAAQVPVAPRTREAAMAQLGELAKEIPGDGQRRDVTNLDDLAQSAAGVVERLTPEELVNTFGSSQISDIQPDAKGFAILRAGRDKLSQMLREDPQNGDIKEALVNTFDAMAERSSGNALVMRVVQEEFDAMPIEAKVRYLIKKIDGANQTVEGYESIRRDPANLQRIENELTYWLQQSQNKAEKLTGLIANAQAAADAARKGERINLKGLAKEVKNSDMELRRLNGELVKYFEELVPKRSLANKALVDTPKRMMLFSGTGRLNDVLTTGFNVLEQQTTNFTQGIIAKGVNAIGRLAGRPGAVTDTLKGASKLPGGAWQGLKKTVGEIRGNQYTENLERSLKSNEELRSGLQKSRGKLNRTIQASTELATNLTEGVKTQRLVQLANQEGKKLGLKGDMLKQYTEARTIAPSRNMVEAADKLKMEINNLNDNPVSRKLNTVSATMGGNSVVGGIIKNQILPFTNWLGGNIYNSVMDKNAIASSLKFANALRKGDPEAAVRNAARTINGVVEGYVLGYQLTKQGVLVDANAEGYTDDGPFVHVGDRYIPVKFFGFFAPNIVLGNAAYAATEGNEAGANPASVIVDKVGNYSWNSLAFGQALGTDNTFNRAVDAANRSGGSTNDGLATAGAGAAGQFIPGVAGDTNAVLNNYTDLNPTREAAETRVGKTGLTPTGRESKAKDVPASVVAGLKNRIPLLSQSLPRKEGVPAKDLVDRTVRGDRDSTTSIKKREDAKTEKDIAEDWKKRDIPNYKETGFDDKVKARFENAEYDKAIEAAVAKYEADSANKDIPKSKLVEQEEKIKLSTVHKEGKFDPKLVDKYKSLSLTEWRNMSDPDNDEYDPTTYQAMYDYDNALAAAGISGSSLDPTRNKYTAKKPGKGRGGSGRGGSGGRSPKIGNDLGEIVQLKRIDFGEMKLEKTQGAKIPTIQQVKPGDLVKKRTISVKRGR